MFTGLEALDGDEAETLPALAVVPVPPTMTVTELALVPRVLWLLLLVLPLIVVFEFRAIPSKLLVAEETVIWPVGLTYVAS